jgi:hypothetical protein
MPWPLSPSEGRDIAAKAAVAIRLRRVTLISFLSTHHMKIKRANAPAVTNVGSGFQKVSHLLSMMLVPSQSAHTSKDTLLESGST